MAPRGGVNLSGGEQVTITSTQPGSIYYTTDGTTPSASNGALYTGSIELPVGAATLLRAVQISGETYSETVTAPFRNYGFRPNDTWYDQTTGDAVQAFSGGITGPIGGLYYWVGQDDRTEAISSCCGVQDDQHPLLLYSSPDLYNWSMVGGILPNPGYQSLTRAHIVYNALTSTYVLWSHCAATYETLLAGPNYACIATAPAVSGPWQWVKLGYDPDGTGFKDDNLFVDADGTGYVIHTAGCQCGIAIDKLAADYLSYGGQNVTAITGGLEDPVMFLRNGVYFLIFGNSTLYASDSQDTNPRYMTASSPLGPWGGAAAAFASDPLGTPFNGQPTAIIPVAGTQDGWLYVADYWRTPLWTSSHLFLPVVFPTSTTLQVQTPATWDLSYFP